MELCDPLKAEANAALLALSKAKEMGFPNIICEGDALNVIPSLQCFTISLHSTIVHVILEARRFIGSFSN